MMQMIYILPTQSRKLIDLHESKECSGQKWDGLFTPVLFCGDAPVGGGVDDVQGTLMPH